MTIVNAVVLVAFLSAPALAQNPAPAPAPPAADALGTWDALFNSQQGPIPAQLKLTKTGDKITGTITSDRGTSAVEAEVKDKTLSVWFNMTGQNGPIAIELTGTIDGDKMKGVTMAAGQPAGDWTATRGKADTSAAAAKTAAAPAAAAAATAASSLTGDWIVAVELPNMTANPTITLKQDGEKLTGDYVSAQYGKFPISGTVKGADVTLSFSMSIEGNAFGVTYTGTVQKDGSLKGDVNYGDMMSGTFSATRKK